MNRKDAQPVLGSAATKPPEGKSYCLGQLFAVRTAVALPGKLLRLHMIDQFPYDLVAHKLRGAVDVLAKGPQAEVHAGAALVQ